MIVAFQTLIYFRESLLTALDWLIPIWPYYKKWTLANNGVATEDGEEDEVFADYDEEKGVVFYPPVYAQRYAAVVDCLMDDRWSGKIQKVVDFGYNDLSFIKYLKEVPGVQCILGVDIESLPLRCSSDILGCDDFSSRRESQLQITLYQGNAADPDYRLIGCDAVVAIEMIEHMLPHDLERLVHNIFGFIKPQIAVITTPNGDFNVLFKALEKNGLRRLDHFFEWSREQFHDWCSNIVSRYREYTVTCKGIGPGPPGTERLGCCSQLALFICKDYHKQKELDLNCLALVANAPNHNNLDDMTDSWESPDPITETNMLCAPENTESYAELPFSEKQSYTSIHLPSTCVSQENLHYKDKTSQCNIDVERGKNFLMFDDEILCYNVLIPQRKMDTKVYEFEDVTSRLNCSTLQVKNFSKNAKNLMAMNKLDSLVHTREIVDEIRHMTKMLNFDKGATNNCLEEPWTWNNINWGENAPYWNQYFKVIKEINYPFEHKSEENRILDLIYDEINRLIETRDNQTTLDANKLEIPLDHLMQIVKHLTEDVDMVRDLLEWNGYKIVDDVVIYSRLVADGASVTSLDDDWQENDALSDWETSEVLSMSDGSTIPDPVYGRRLRRALDSKLKKLRSMTDEEDVTTELDRIVCRLMKLALRSSKDTKSPPPATWMQRKLLDLLSLTEKAIERRRKRFIESYPLKGIEYDQYACTKNQLGDGETLSKNKNDTVEQLVDKYLMPSDPDSDNFVVKSELHYTEENLSTTSNETNLFTRDPASVYGEVRLESMKSSSKEEIHLEITQAWLDGESNDTAFGDDYIKSNVASSDSNTSNDVQYRQENTSKKCMNEDNQKNLDFNVSSKYKQSKFSKTSKINGRDSKTKLIKKLSKKNSGHSTRRYSKKIEYVEYKSYTFNKQNKSVKDHHNLQPTLSKPIPRSLIELCYQDVNTEKNNILLESSIRNHEDDTCNNVAATKESVFIDIVSEDTVEKIALRRSTATEADQNLDNLETEALLESVIGVTREGSFNGDHVVPFEAEHSETIFLYDLNEPTTSKGIRHVSADAQCGPDIKNVTPTPSTVTVNLHNICKTGIKIGDSFTNLKFYKDSVDFGTITDENKFYRDFVSPFNTTSIKIKDSNTNLTSKADRSTMAQDNDFKLDSLQVMPEILTSESKSHFGNARDSKSALRCLLKHPSDIGMSQKMSVTKYVRPRLSCCGIHIHSYRNRQISEDIVFQGQWQQRGPSVLVRKSPSAQLTSRKREIVKRKKNDSKEKALTKKHEKIITNIVENKSVYKRNVKYSKENKELVTKHNKISNIVNVDSATKKLRSNRSITKVASKIITSVTPSKSLKNVCAGKNRIIKKSSNLQQNSCYKIISRNENLLRCNKIKQNQVIGSSNKLNKNIDNSIPLKKAVPPVNQLKPVKDNLFEFNKRKKVTYLVFRNEIENTRNVTSSSARTIPKIINTRSTYSPPSQNSSPCSSPNSISTVRAFPKKSSNKIDSASPERHNFANTSVESTEKYKTCVPNNTSTKSMNSTSVSRANKENLPETSKRCDIPNTDNDKSQIAVRDKNVFLLRAKADCTPLLDHKKSVSKIKSVNNSKNNSNTKMSRKKNTTINISVPSLSSLKSSSNQSYNSPVRYHKESDKRNTNSRDPSDEREASEINYLTRSSTPILDLNTQNIEKQECAHVQLHSKLSYTKQSNSQINAAMKQLIEERLSFIKQIQDNNDSDSETIILSRDDNDELLHSTSPLSYKTVITNDDSHKIAGSDLENALLRTFESNLGSLCSNQSTMPGTGSDFLTDSDLLSFGSIKSVENEVLSHQNELDKTLVPEVNSNTKTVRDLFERKEQPILINTGGTIAVQVFSGFSMNGEPMVGDQPEYISLVDPETGNLALELARQATSEEIFVSGRSSDTYESCYVDDDAYVPNWLFHVINQQSSELAEEEEEPENEPAAEPDFDVNGNAIEAGFGVGAGDGRGMHSDQSQDSSGRGTSISSSDVSSGPQSEAILIDPSSFLGSGVNAALIGSTTVPNESSETSFRTVETVETDNETRAQYNRETSRETTQRRVHRAAAASDADADVSSLDTDAPDSDN